MKFIWLKVHLDKAHGDITMLVDATRRYSSADIFSFDQGMSVLFLLQAAKDTVP